MADVGVRAARTGDAPAIAAVQAAAWQQAYGDVLPVEVLDAVASEQAADQWRTAVAAPPSPHHHILVALAGAEVVGFAALVPVAESGAREEPLTEPATEAADGTQPAAELVALCVRPDRTGAGHGSRLVNAAADHLRDDGFRAAWAWVAVLGAEDEHLRAFLEGAGWAADGARRRLDLRGDGAVLVPQVRLATVL